jgi:hypothetical protein
MRTCRRVTYPESHVTEYTPYPKIVEDEARVQAQRKNEAMLEAEKR